MRQCRQLDQAVPVGIVACQARDFQSQHDTGTAHCHFGRQALEAVAMIGLGT